MKWRLKNRALLRSNRANDGSRPNKSPDARQAPRIRRANEDDLTGRRPSSPKELAELSLTSRHVPRPPNWCQQTNKKGSKTDFR